MTRKNKTEAEDSFRIASKMRAALGRFKMLSTENSSVAERLYLRLTDGIGQLNEFICISVRDYVYETVEIERLRAFSSGMVAVTFRERIAEQIHKRRLAIALLLDPEKTGIWGAEKTGKSETDKTSKPGVEKTSKSEADQRSKSEADQKSKLEAQKKNTEAHKACLEAEIEILEAIKPTDEDYAAAFVKVLPSYEAVSRLIALAQARRATALRDIEFWQAALAQRLRQVSENIIEGEYRDQTIQPASPAVAGPAVSLPAVDPTEKPVRRRASSTRSATSAARAPLSTSQVPLFDNAQSAKSETVALASRARVSTEPAARPVVDEAKTPPPIAS